MCMLIVGTAQQIRDTVLGTPRLLESIIHRNPDGIGAMFMTRAGLPYAVKRAALPDAEYARAWLDSTLPGNGAPCAVHARYATHGKVDRENCHPFELDGGYFMHNGVLHIDTSADTSKSDTRHYMERYLAGRTQTLLSDHYGRELVGEHIDGNKFAWLSPDGHIYVVNRAQGFEWGDVWFSNTYALDMSIIDPTYRVYTTTGDPRAAKTLSHVAESYYGADGAGGHATSILRWAVGYESADPGAFADETLGDWDVDTLPILSVDDVLECLEECGVCEVVYALHDRFGAPAPFADADAGTAGAPALEARAVEAVMQCDPAALADIEDTGYSFYVALAIAMLLEWGQPEDRELEADVEDYESMMACDR